MKPSQELFEFLVQEAGGAKEVYHRYYQSKIGELAREGKTVEELLEIADEGNWKEWFLSLKLSEVAETLNPVGSTAAPVRRKRSGRMTHAEKEALYESILEFAKSHPWCSSSEISDFVNVSTRKLGPHLKQLRDAGDLTSVGERAAMRYALPDTPEPGAKPKKAAKATPPVKRKGKKK